MSYRVESEYERKQREAWEKKYQAQEYRERIAKAAAGYIEKRQSAAEFAQGTGYTSAADIETYNELLKAAEHQAELDAAFLDGFMNGDKPRQAKLSRDYH